MKVYMRCVCVEEGVNLQQYFWQNCRT